MALGRRPAEEVGLPCAKHVVDELRDILPDAKKSWDVAVTRLAEIAKGIETVDQFHACEEALLEVAGHLGNRKQQHVIAVFDEHLARLETARLEQEHAEDQRPNIEVFGRLCEIARRKAADLNRSQVSEAADLVLESWGRVRTLHDRLLPDDGLPSATVSEIDEIYAITSTALARATLTADIDLAVASSREVGELVLRSLPACRLFGFQRGVMLASRAQFGLPA